MTQLGHAVMRGVALTRWICPRAGSPASSPQNPTILFRIFHYPRRHAAVPTDAGDGWGVGEHTDYGLLTILLQDDTGGLQVRSRDGWIDVPPNPTRVRLQHRRHARSNDRRRYRSTPHRVRNTGTRGRLSFPFFFDPGWDARVRPVPGVSSQREPSAQARWDGASVHDLTGTYGEYLLGKVSKVFPAPRPTRTASGCERHFRLSATAGRVRPAARAGKNATRLTSTSAPIAVSNTARTGIVALVCTPEAIGDAQPNGATDDDADGYPDDEADGRQRRGLPRDGRAHLAPAEPDGLEQRELTTSPTHRGDEACAPTAAMRRAV